MDEVIETVVASRIEHIEIFLENILPLIFTNAHDYGLDLSKEDCTQSTALFIESFKAALYDTCGIEHVLQDFAKESFTIVDEEFTMNKPVEPTNTVDIGAE
jgi:hypothetical protein